MGEPFKIGKKKKIQISVVPPEKIATPPYSNSLFIFTESTQEVTIVFLRTPLLNDEQMAKVVASGTKKIEGDIVSSVTLSRQSASELRDLLVRLL